MGKNIPQKPMAQFPCLRKILNAILEDIPVVAHTFLIQRGDAEYIGSIPQVSFTLSGPVGAHNAPALVPGSPFRSRSRGCAPNAIDAVVCTEPLVNTWRCDLK